MTPSIEEALRSGAVRLVPVEATPDMAAAGEVALVDVLHGVYYSMPNGGMRRVLRSAITASPDHTPALVALIEERDRFRAERDGLAIELRDCRILSDSHRQNADEHRRDRLAAEARALAAEAELARRNAAEEEAAREAFCLHMQERNAREAAEAKCDALQEALARAQSWHESEDKALSKSGRSDADYHWRRLQHREQLDAIRGALPESEYEAAWGRMNARYEQETADVGE